MKHRILLIALVSFFNNFIYAQNKYALLIGINEYQIKDTSGKTVLDPNNALFGCVNDALSMKDILIKKYEFSSSNITTLLNTKASKSNILKQIDVLLSRCKNGDVAVVFFAGHGMPYRYGQGAEDIAEVILPSNAFATIPFSYIQQAELAKKFNLFVDKKVTLTAIFDCCFSLATSSKGSLMIPNLLNVTDTSQTIIEEEEDWVEPLPIEPQDADEYELLPNDSILNEEIVITSSSLEMMKNRGLNESQYKEMTRHVKPFGFSEADTSYNPPSQREQSQFIFLSATNDKQKAPEMRDENGKKRGAFTLALTKVMETNPATVSFKEIFYKTVIQLKSYGKEITPSARYKPNQRENKNLFGIAPNELKLKVYLPTEICTFNDLNSMYKNWVLPLNTDDYKSQSLTKTNHLCSKIYIINNGKSVFFIDGKTKKSKVVSNINALKTLVKGHPYFIYLPVPNIITDIIRKECLKNNKIELVNDMSKADVSLYCTNYSNKSGLLSTAVDIGKNLTDNIINHDYKERLSFVGSNETVGVKRNKPGHYYSLKEDVVILATEKSEIIAKKIMEWLNTKTVK